MRCDGYCPREDEILDGLATGELDPDKRAHAASCTACGDAMEAFAALRSAAEVNPALPPPGLIWWKAHIAERRAALDRAMRPIRFLEAAAVAAGVAVTVTLASSLSASTQSPWIRAALVCVPLLSAVAVLAVRRAVSRY